MFVKNLTNKYQANSVACIFMHIIACSFSIAGSSEINSPIISTIAQNIPEKTSNYINTVDSLDLIQSHIEKNITENDLVTELLLGIIKLDTKLKQQEENYKNLFDAKALLDNKLSASLLENKALNNQLSQLNDTCKQISYQDQKQKQTLAEYLEINKKYTKSLETLLTCEHRVLSDQINFEKNLTILELEIKDITDEKNNTKVEMQRIIDSLQLEISLKTQQYSNISLQLENKINENEKTIQESIVLKKEQAEKLKAIENEYQLNSKNKQHEVEIFKEIIFEINNEGNVEIADLWKTLISITKLNEDNIPDDLLKKRQEFFRCIYLIENQALVVFYIRKLFDDIALTSNSQFSNKYFCNKKISHYDKNICALLSEDVNSYEINLSVRTLVVPPKDMFTGFKNLKKLDLSSTQLYYLESGTFNNLSNLKDLWLQENHLTSLPKDIFTGLENLESIVLRSNRLHYFDSDIFNNLPKLNKLYIHQNNLTTDLKNILKEKYSQVLQVFYIENFKF